MEFEEASNMKPSTSLGGISVHNRSKSDHYEIVKEDNLNILLVAPHRLKLDMGHMRGNSEPMNKETPNTKLQISLKQEILQLEKRLQDQFVERKALEKALGYKSSSQYTLDECSISKPATELIKEIAVLELEVVYLEQYLLTLYRKAFDEQSSILSPSTKDETLKSPKVSRLGLTPKIENLEVQSSRFRSPRDSVTKSQRNHVEVTEKLLDSGIDRSQSSLSQHSAFSTRTSPPRENHAKSLQSSHSQPLYLENAETKTSTSNIITLAEHLGTRISDHIPETPNRISEDMIKCMSTIYCKLSDPLTMNHGISSSPISCSSPISSFSPRYQYDMWSPRCRKDFSFDSRLDNPFHIEGLKEFSGPYSTMVEVPWIYADSQRMSDIDHLLQNYRSLVTRLEDIDLRKMKHEEKLAFWINIHNALVMHTFLVYGIPQTSLKRVSLLLKAAYNIGGETISTDMIQNVILGCAVPRPSQWFRTLFSPRTKFKAGDDRKAYVIDQTEPLLHFALCSGSHSDPAVRMYTPKKVFLELESAKEEYIRATFGVRSKVQKILLPKIVESFTKDLGLCPVGLLEMIQKCMPDNLRKTMKRYQQQGGFPRKSIEWISHNFTFRYLISKELAK
ncbi:hypothetical protein C5167_010746 [Papaver somniferum]|uniref:DUF547 domain-containing protein n=1 Tax=Papaver somniferum TaxID=3469 RepID=A0A4Y7K2K3_PAPSO|nr:uncharacterized protein LOC113289274 isoform X2 [Papaver somniferum]RZC67056.1 hypothetical protein C5167_010746 [Papaver somniferum]